MVMSICLLVYDLVTVGFDKADAGPISAIAFSILVLLTTGEATRLSTSTTVPDTKVGTRDNVPLLSQGSQTSSLPLRGFALL
jgi:hypothetical protein